MSTYVDTRCQRCYGRRIAKCSRCGGFGYPRRCNAREKINGRCDLCSGTGNVSCPACGGVGVVPALQSNSRR
jgi:DnaJ-class molecular chaperone